MRCEWRKAWNFNKGPARDEAGFSMNGLECIHDIPYFKTRRVARVVAMAVYAITLLEILAFRQSVEGSFCLEFSCFVLCFKTKNEVGI